MTTPRSTEGPDPDTDLLAAVARVWQQADPPPDDLAAGVLARLAAEDLEVELLVLVEGADALAGVRHAAREPEETDESAESGAWTLEYEGPDLHVYLRLSRVGDRRRLDGWVVPARALPVELRTEGRAEPLVTTADELGRFEVADAPAGLARLGFPATTGSERPRATPPFWI